MIQSLFERAWERKYAFFATFFVVFLFSYLLLVAIDFVPEPKVETEQDTEESTSVIEHTADSQEVPVGNFVEPVKPTSMYIKRLDRSVPILNPDSSSVSVLDEALLSGVVRHPESALLGESGNVFILGHSSHLPSVMNKNFQAFNGIEKLEWGDVIEVTADNQVYVYEVQKVFKASAQDTTVPVASENPMLILATCNNFGAKDDRFIVEAKRTDIRTL
jgi:LPXTG-site transpeptidase (sortase) family protein